MAFISDYLAGHGEAAVFLCLGLGFLAGRIRIGSFRLGATVGTLLCSLLVGQLAPFSLSDQLKSTFFIMFSFVLGYESGPAFFSNLRSSGLKAVLLAAFYGVITLVVILGVCWGMGYDTGTAAGLLAGAQTQSSVLGVVKGDGASSAAATVTYALSYIFGTVGPILFMRKIGPAMLKVNLNKAVKERTDAQGGAALTETTQAAAIQVRAYVVGAASGCVGQTIACAERRYPQKMQIEKVFRDGSELAVNQDSILQAGDVIVVIGRVDAITAFDDDDLTEIADPAYLQLTLATAELIVTAEETEHIHGLLDGRGILLGGVHRNDKPVPRTQWSSILPGDRLKLTGPAHALRETAAQLGYIRDTGDGADMPFFALAVAAGIVLGSFYVDCSSVPLSLGASGGALLAGLISGWIHQKKPRYCYLPGAARWLVRSMGLNLFIAVTALNAARSLGPAIGWHCIPLLLAGGVVTLLPHALALLFGRHVLKMEAVDILGGLCGSGTCTPALNALAEDTDGAAFASSYSPAYAVGNVLLTVIGILVSMLI